MQKKTKKKKTKKEMKEFYIAQDPVRWTAEARLNMYDDWVNEMNG